MSYPRTKISQADVFIGIAALDIVINRIAPNPAFDYELGRSILVELQGYVERPSARIGRRKARCVLQAIRLSLRAVGNPEMSMQARPIIDRLEGFVNHA